MNSTLKKIGWFFRGRYAPHCEAPQPKLKDFPHLAKYFTEHPEEYHPVRKAYRLWIS